MSKFVTIFLFMLLASQSAMAQIIIRNVDSTGEGFNDPAPFTATGGNAAQTLGQARLNLFRHTALLVDAMISSPVPITVRSFMNPLGGTANSAVLGGAGPLEVFRDFPGAPHSNTWYVGALANALYGADLSAEDEILAEFNSDVDNDTVLGTTHWHYGFDKPSNNDIEFMPTVKHELIHGLGFISLVNQQGQLYIGNIDAFSRYLEHHGATPADFPSMTDEQRATALVDDGNLHWTGSNVRSASSFLSVGKVGDHVQMYAPTTYSPGSSVSHFDIDVTPDDLMEPFLTPDPFIVVAAASLADIGWSISTHTPELAETDLITSARITGTVSPGTNETSVEVTAINNSIYSVNDATFEFLVPSNITVGAPTVSSGSCEQITNLLRCNLGSLPGLSDNVQFTFTASVDDGLAQELKFNLSGPLFDHSMANNQASIIINPPATPPDIFISDARAEEGQAGDNTEMIFTVLLSSASTSDISLDYVTSENSAVAGADFSQSTGSITIPAGSTSGLIRIPLLSDSTPESDESFTLSISNPDIGTITDPDAIGTIINDDPILIGVSNATVTEGNSGDNPELIFTISLSLPYNDDLSVEYSTRDGTAVQPADYVAKSGTLIINAGETSAVIPVTVNGDNTYEANESMTLVLSNPSTPAKLDPGQSIATGTITNDDAAPSSGGGGGGSMGLFLLALLLTLFFRPRLLNQLKR